MKDWLENRTGLVTVSKEFLDEPLPQSVGWKNTLGAIAGALFLAQIATGALMMLFYVPHPEAAYETVEYIEQGLVGGELIRALHYWGASFMITGLFFHMIRVFLWGAYKKPREATWLVGLAMFGIVLGITFTGQLLPMNQTGFWAAKVGIEIGSSAPLIGPLIKQMILGGETIGALTLTRFYTLHVFLLPGLLALLIAFHIYLLRRHGPVTGPNEDTTKTEPFYPFHMARDLIVITIVLLGLFGISLIKGGPIEPPADPSDTGYVPRPEWYFMSHFEVLRMTPGNLKILATTVLPGVMLLLFAALPWMDRAKTTAFGRRKLVLLGGTIVFASIVGFTAKGVMREDPRAEHVAAVDPDYDPAKAGRRLYRDQGCQQCHKIGRKGTEIGPDLSNIGDDLSPKYLKDWLINPKKFRPNTKMPPSQLKSKELDELVAYLLTLKVKKD
jgi:ubiquinol-cytochrome c reductase cytochrome b subunit